MRRLRYAINTTLDGCCHHEAGLPPDDESMAWWTGRVGGAGALLWGRVTFEMMAAAWRRPATGGWANWMQERETRFAEALDRTPKVVFSRTLTDDGWAAEVVRDDAVAAVRRLKQQPGPDLLLGGVRLPVALADAGLVDEYELLVHPVLAGHGPSLLAGLQRRVRLELVDRRELGSGVVLHVLRPAPPG